jgi:hypothetical protein
MAWVFAEEFARLGFGATQILRIFRSPYFAGAHRAFQALGEDEITAIVADCTRVWGRAVDPGSGASARGTGQHA